MFTLYDDSVVHALHTNVPSASKTVNFFILLMVIPSHFNKSFHMTVSELDETWYASSTFGFVMSDKISLSFIVWFPG